MNASFLGTNTFAVAGDKTDALQPGVRVLADCGADGARCGTVSAASFDAGADRTTVTLAMDADGLTADLASVLHGNDIPASLAHHGHAGPADGGMVAHGALSGVGANSHDAIDAFMAARAAPSGLATLDGNTLVIQNPANATATPGGTKIVMSDASGTVDAWVSEATASAKGKVQLATAAETAAGVLAAKAVTPAGLATSAKGLLAANTTIYVATTGSDATGDGSSAAPFASIAQALASIKNKLIASGVLVTIQVADGTYSISSTIVINHPDANKIQILGNMSAETSVAISAINTTAKTITVVGNYVSNADATKNIQAGDIIILSGSSTSGLNGSYRVSSVSYDGTNTTVTTQGALSSSTVGGGSVIIKPANRCVLNFSSSVSGFTISFSNLYLLAGVKIKSTGNTTGVGVYCFGCPLVVIKYAVVDGFNNGVHGYPNTGIELDYCAIIGQNSYGMLSAIGTNIGCVGTFIGDTTSYPMMATQGAFIRFLSGGLANNGGSNIPSPAFNTSGNSNSYISNT